MVKLIFSLLILALGMLQVTVLDMMKIFFLKPDLLLLAAVTVTLMLDFKAAFILSLFAGLLKDVFSANPFGINTVLFALWSFAIMKLSRKIPLDYDIIRVALAAIIVVLHNIISAVFLVYYGEFISVGIILRTVIIGSLYTTAFFLPVFKISELILLRLMPFHKNG